MSATTASSTSARLTSRFIAEPPELARHALLPARAAPRLAAEPIVPAVGEHAGDAVARHLALADAAGREGAFLSRRERQRGAPTHGNDHHDEHRECAHWF